MSAPSELGVVELDDPTRRPLGQARDRRRWARPRVWPLPGGLAGLGVALLSLALAAWALRLWRADLGVPLRYSSGDDTLFYLSLIKAISTHGWFWTNHNLGAPFGQQLFDYPQSADNLNFLMVKALTLVATPAVVLNLFYLLTYPLDALAAFWVMRRLGVSTRAAAVCAVLFALLPYHLFRSDSHLFLSAYYALPLAAYLFILILRGEPLVERRGPPARGPMAWASRRSLQTLVICLLLASDGLYYAVFSLILVGAGVLIALAARRPRAAVLSGLAAWVLVAVVLSANLAPTIVYRADHGANPQVSRAPVTGDDLALSASYLVLPWRDDRIKPLRSLTRRYFYATPRASGYYCEQCYESLGTVGDVGFIWLGAVLIGALVGAPLLIQRRSVHRYAAAGVAVCLAVGITGALSSLVRVFVTADIRAWNRLSVLIAFFSLLATGLLLDGLRRRLTHPSWRWGFGLLLAGVLAFGAFDQTTSGSLVPYADDATIYHSDQAFFASVQRVVPRGAAIMELPYVPFPEGYQPFRDPNQTVPYAPAVGLEYDQARGFINSSDLRWSYGAVKGRPADWQSQLAAKPVALSVIGAAAAGFQGLVVDLSGYPNQLELQRALAQVMGAPPFTSHFGDLLFYDLRPLAHRLHRSQPSRLAALRAAVLTPLRVSCASGQLTIENPSRGFRQATLTASASQPVVLGGVPAQPRDGSVRIPLRLAPGSTTLSLQGLPGAKLDGPTLYEPAFAPFARGPGASILSGIVGPPCLNVAAAPS